MITVELELTESRLVAEREAISSRYPGLRMHSLQAGPPTFEGIIEVDGTPHHVRLTLPPSYPRVPPLVRELDGATGKEVPTGGRLNRLEGWGICLFPHGNDEQAWRTDLYAVTAVDRFVEFIRHEGERGSRIHLARDRLHLPPSIANLLELGPGSLVTRRAAAGGDFYVTGIHFLRDPGLDFAIDAAWHDFLPVEFDIPFFTIVATDPWSELASTVEALDATLRRELPPSLYQEHRVAPWFVLARASGSGASLACIHRPAAQIGTLLELPIVHGTLEDCLFNRVDSVLARREHLADETVIIVGLGSIGSAVALALARAGIQRFVLIDPDTLTIENVCRHSGTLRDIGRYKVEVVADQIGSVNPAVRVEPIPKWLAWDLPWLSAGVEFERALASLERCLVVTTCAVADVERQINAMAVRAGVPTVYASALGAAEHGRIFRVLPQESPCLECILIAQDSDPSRFPRFRALEARNDGEAPYLGSALPGLGIDITAIAMIAARFALQTIAELRGIDLGLPPEPGDHLLWTNRGGWLFDRPQQLLVEHFPRSPSCPVCGIHRGANR